MKRAEVEFKNINEKRQSNFKGNETFTDGIRINYFFD